MQLYAAKLRKRLTGMDPEFVQLLLHYDWRGNVRELKNVLERAVILAVNFRLGFRIQPRINLLFRRVLEDMGAKGEIDITSRYATLQRHKLPGDFRFVVLDKILSYDNQLSFFERFVLKGYFFFNKLAITDQQAFGLDTSDVVVENVPLTIQPYRQLDLMRMPPESSSDPVPAAALAGELMTHKV